MRQGWRPRTRPAASRRGGCSGGLLVRDQSGGDGGYAERPPGLQARGPRASERRRARRGQVEAREADAGTAGTPERESPGRSREGARGRGSQPRRARGARRRGRGGAQRGAKGPAWGEPADQGRRNRSSGLAVALDWKEHGAIRKSWRHTRAGSCRTGLNSCDFFRGGARGRWCVVAERR